MFNPDTPELVRALSEADGTVEGRIRIPRSKLPLNEASIARRAEAVKAGQVSMQLDFAAEDRLHEFYEQMSLSFPGMDHLLFMQYSWESFNRWNIFLNGVGDLGKEGQEDAFQLPMIEGVANALEHGSKNSDIELITLFSRTEIAVILRSSIDPETLEKTQASLQQIENIREELHRFHRAIDKETDQTKKMIIIDELLSTSLRKFTSPHPEAPSVDSGFRPSQWNRGNNTVQLAVSRMNYAWRRIVDDVIFEQSILFSDQRYAEIEKELQT